MNIRKLTLAGAVAGLMTAMTAPMAYADMFASTSNWGCLANQGGNAVALACSASKHNSEIPYIAGENVFYGPLRQGGQCLDVQGTRVLFAACNGSKGQTWKLAGNGQLNNENSVCIAGSGSSVVTRGCPGGGAWVNATYKVVSVPGLNAARGTPLRVQGRDIVNANSGQIVAAGAGNIVAGGAGNIVAGGAGNIVAGGAGNIIVSQQPNIASIVAGGAGN